MLKVAKSSLDPVTRWRGVPTPRAVGIRWFDAAQKQMDEKTKPVGSLGYVEFIACRVAAIQRTITPSVEPGRVVIFVGDHGVSEENVSAYPQVVTRQMALNFARGGAAISVIARAVELQVEIVDVGIRGPRIRHSRVLYRRVRSGTRNFARVPAMTKTECLQALQVGIERAREAHREGVKCLILGEMGIGNSTSAAAVVASLFRVDPRSVVGRGTGVCGASLRRKIETVERVVANKSGSDPLSCLSMFGGFEIAAIAGAAIGGANLGMPVLVDGFISAVGVSVAVALRPSTRDYLFFSHESPEPGHRLVMKRLRQRALLALDMRLGEGTGGAVAFPVVRTASRLLAEMASFREARVSRRLKNR